MPNTPNAELYGIENTNRGCALDAQDTQPIARTRSIAGSGLRRSGTGLQPPRSARVRDRQHDCAAPDARRPGSSGSRPARTTCSIIGEPLDVPVNPGGFAVYRNGRVIGGVGVAGVIPNVPNSRHLPPRRSRRSACRDCRPTRCRCRAPCSSTASACRSSPTCISVQCVLDAIDETACEAIPRGTFADRRRPRAAARRRRGARGLSDSARARAASPGSLTQAEVRAADRAGGGARERDARADSSAADSPDQHDHRRRR